MGCIGVASSIRLTYSDGCLAPATSKAGDHRVHPDACKVTEVPAYAAGADLIVATTTIADSRSVPVIPAIPLLTGIGEQEVLDRIVQVLSQPTPPGGA